MTDKVPGVVLVCAGLHEEGKRILEARANVRYVQPHTKEELIAELTPDVAGMIMGSVPLVDDEVMAHASGLRVVGRPGVGVDNIDLQAAARRGIVVVNTPLAPVEPVAELTLAFMIGLARRIVRLDRGTRQSEWKAGWSYRHSLAGPELCGKTLGLVGFGHIGQRVAELVQPLPMAVLYHDAYPQPEAEARLHARRVDLPTLFRESDYVSVHVPLTKDTRHLVGYDLFRLMKPTAYFINMARGPVVDEPALVRALQEGLLAGAATDVFEEEPPREDNPLFALDNVILMPHMGGISLEGIRDMSMVVLDILAVLEGRPPKHPVVAR